MEQKLIDDQVKRLINTNQVAITEIGNQLKVFQEKIERLWEMVNKLEQRRISDMNDQWKMISDLNTKVEELAKKD